MMIIITYVLSFHADRTRRVELDYSCYSTNICGRLDHPDPGGNGTSYRRFQIRVRNVSSIKARRKTFCYCPSFQAVRKISINQMEFKHI